MSRFRIHRSFEEELAKKADEFSMQPSLSTWQGVEKGIKKTHATQTYWKIGILSLSLLAILGIFLIQEDKQTTHSATSETGITLLNPLSELPVVKDHKNQSGGTAPVETKLQERSAEFAKAPASNPETSRELVSENKSVMDDASVEHAQKIALRPVKPKSTGIRVFLEKISGHPIGNREKEAPGIRSRDGWYIQANFAPAYAYRNISARTDYARPLEDSKKRLDKGVSGYSGRIQARYYFSDRFSLAFGLAYTRSGERIGMAPKKNSPVYNALAEEYGYETSEMNALGDVSYYTNQYSYAELPITLYSKRPLSPRLSLTTGLGLSLGYMVSNNARCYDYRVDHYVNNPKFYRDWTIGSHAQILLEYSLNTRWVIAAGPEFNYALLSTYRDYYTLSQHQFSAGLNVGVQWKLFDITKSRLGE